jgi:hypothetical protein
MGTKRFLAATCIAALTLAACGSGSGSGAVTLNAEEKTYVDAMMTSFEKDSSTPFTSSQAQCLAERTVKAIGVDALKKAGVTPENINGDSGGLDKLDAASATKLTDLMFGGECFNFGDLMVKAMNAQGGGKIPDDKAKCLGDKMGSNSAFRKAMTESMTGNTTVDPMAALGDIFKLLSDCKISLSDLTPSSAVPTTT